MAEPWKLSSSSLKPQMVYHHWVKKNYQRFNGHLCLCNWFPLRVIVEFAADKGLRLKLAFWRGRAPTKGGGRRHWNTNKEFILDSHGGRFRARLEYRKKVESTVTARMIGTLNAVSIDQAAALPGDLVLKDYRPEYWHVELITKIQNGVIYTESGSTPAKVPKHHRDQYRGALSQDSDIYQGKPIRWDFSELFG